MEAVVRGTGGRGKAHRGLEAGDIMPPFRLPDQTGRQVDLLANDLAGKPSVVILCADPATPEAARILSGFRDIGKEVLALDGRIFAISRLSSEANAAACGALDFGFPVLADPDGRAFAAYGMPDRGEPAVFIAAANQHLLAVVPAAEPAEAVRALEIVRAQAGLRHPRRMEIHPPVLVVPGVLSREDCQRLITLFNMEGNVWVEPGHGDKGMTSDYKMRVPEYGRGDRVDHWVINAATRDFISGRLRDRLFPEIQKSFQYRVTKAETYRIGSYEGERGGDLHGHRDNTSTLVAHRRFAVSINLNSEEFQGGELRFPEFGDQRYKPETGAAIAFSCSLLHEPLEVTEGRRFVLMAFLFGEH
jgi:peroxiredoxin